MRKVSHLLPVISMSKLSVYGATGFIGGTFCDLYPDEVIKISRDQREPESKAVSYTHLTLPPIYSV